MDSYLKEKLDMLESKDLIEVYKFVQSKLATLGQGRDLENLLCNCERYNIGTPHGNLRSTKWQYAVSDDNERAYYILNHPERKADEELMTYILEFNKERKHLSYIIFCNGISIYNVSFDVAVTHLSKEGLIFFQAILKKYNDGCNIPGVVGEWANVERWLRMVGYNLEEVEVNGSPSNNRK